MTGSFRGPSPTSLTLSLSRTHAYTHTHALTHTHIHTPYILNVYKRCNHETKSQSFFHSPTIFFLFTFEGSPRVFASNLLLQRLIPLGGSLRIFELIRLAYQISVADNLQKTSDTGISTYLCELR
jgi:hypothetical protein